MMSVLVEVKGMPRSLTQPSCSGTAAGSMEAFMRLAREGLACIVSAFGFRAAMPEMPDGKGPPIVRPAHPTCHSRAVSCIVSSFGFRAAMEKMPDGNSRPIVRPAHPTCHAGAVSCIVGGFGFRAAIPEMPDGKGQPKAGLHTPFAI